VLEKGIIHGSGNLIVFNAGSSFSTNATEIAPADENCYINGCVRKISNTVFTFLIGDFEEFAPISISAPDGEGSIADYYTKQLITARAKGFTIID